MVSCQGQPGFGQGNVETHELKDAFEKAATEVKEADISSWSVAEWEEAAELFERNPVCKEVGDSVSKNIEEGLTDPQLEQHALVCIITYNSLFIIISISNIIYIILSCMYA